jgi:hypothetical protein
MPVAAIPGGLAPFQHSLIGTWTNAPLPGAPNGEGGPNNPLSYNVMPLPQTASEGSRDTGYILKNSTIYEVVKFNSDSDVAISTTAPNRGGDVLQAPTALYYQQQVYFGDGPGKGTIVHTENGLWLNVAIGEKLIGPYFSQITLDVPNTQPPDSQIAKQMSIPHGNSVLALGSYPQSISGAPSIPDVVSIYPTPSGLDLTPYTTVLDQIDDYENPQPALTLNPHAPLQQAVILLDPTDSIQWSVTTELLADGTQGEFMNIPFEQREVEVVAYTADYWLLSTDGGHNFPYLAYTQAITLQMTIAGTVYRFPHVTSNVVTKQ